MRVPHDAGEDGVSFLPLLLKQDVPAPRQILAESSIDGSFGIRERQWKLAFCPGSGGWSYPRPGKDNTEGWPPFQLFDLSVDPAEKTNVLAQNSEIVRHLGRLMRDDIVNGRSPPGAPQKNTAVKKDWRQTAWLDEFK